MSNPRADHGLQLLTNTAMGERPPPGYMQSSVISIEDIVLHHLSGKTARLLHSVEDVRSEGGSIASGRHGDSENEVLGIVYGPENVYAIRKTGECVPIHQQVRPVCARCLEYKRATYADVRISGVVPFSHKLLVMVVLATGEAAIDRMKGTRHFPDGGSIKDWIESVDDMPQRDEFVQKKVMLVVMNGNAIDICRPCATGISDYVLKRTLGALFCKADELFDGRCERELDGGALSPSLAVILPTVLSRMQCIHLLQTVHTNAFSTGQAINLIHCFAQVMQVLHNPKHNGGFDKTGLANTEGTGDLLCFVVQMCPHLKIDELAAEVIKFGNPRVAFGSRCDLGLLQHMRRCFVDTRSKYQTCSMLPLIQKCGLPECPRSAITQPTDPIDFTLLCRQLEWIKRETIWRCNKEVSYGEMNASLSAILDILKDNVYGNDEADKLRRLIDSDSVLGDASEEGTLRLVKYLMYTLKCLLDAFCPTCGKPNQPVKYTKWGCNEPSCNKDGQRCALRDDFINDMMLVCGIWLNLLMECANRGMGHMMSLQRACKPRISQALRIAFGGLFSSRGKKKPHTL